MSIVEESSKNKKKSKKRKRESDDVSDELVYLRKKRKLEEKLRVLEEDHKKSIYSKKDILFASDATMIKEIINSEEFITLKGPLYFHTYGHVTGCYKGRYETGCQIYIDKISCADDIWNCEFEYVDENERLDYMKDVREFDVIYDMFHNSKNKNWYEWIKDYWIGSNLKECLKNEIKGALKDGCINLDINLDEPGAFFDVNICPDCFCFVKEHLLKK